MPQMDQFLAEFYGTNKTASAQQEDLENEASVQLFMKVAAEQGIDFKDMTDEKVNALYAQFTQNLEKGASAPAEQKTAAAPADPKAELAKQAEAELAQKHAAQEKIAEADFLGRVMALSLVIELRKIASDSKEPEEEKKKDEKKPEEKAKEAEMPEALRKGLEHVRGGGDKPEEKKKEEEKHEPPKHDDKHEEDKKASAIDALAVEHAVKMAHAGGFDPEEAGRKVAAVRTLNLLKPSEKIASAQTVEQAVEIRALEHLEAAGYPVTWK
jgi:colicin import membrane protein